MGQRTNVDFKTMNQQNYIMPKRAKELGANPTSKSAK